MTTRNPKTKNEGVTLIIVLALIFLLSLMGALFLAIGRSESSTATTQSLNARAKMLANSGIEEGISKKIPATSTRLYLGEDWNKNHKNQNLKSDYNTHSESWNGNNNEQFEYNVHPKYALRPTYFYQEDSGGSDPDPALIPVKENNETKYRGFSGKLPASAQGNDTYTLKIVDNSTKLNINSLNPNIERMINLLYRELPVSEPGKAPGSKIIDERPEVDYNSETKQVEGGYQEVQHLLKDEVLSEDTYERIRPYLTVHSHTWVDRSVIKPQPQSRHAEAGNTSDPTRTDAAFDYNFQFEKQPRAPVNINRVPLPVLTAILTDLQARVIKVHPIENTSPSTGRAVHETVDTEPITMDQARKIADKIIHYRIRNTEIEYPEEGVTERGPFETWPEFEAFVDQVLFDDVDGDGKGNDNGEQIISAEQAHVLKANFNPNTRFSKFNPDRNGRWAWQKGGENSAIYYIDKTDLTYHTTEFTFFGGGKFTIHSYGRVTGPDHQILAESSIKTIVEKYSVLKHTTQRDFIVNRVSDESGKIAYYPEQIQNVGANQNTALEHIKNGEYTGSDMGGKLSIAPKSAASESAESGHHHWNFTVADEVTDSRKETAKDYMSDSLPFGHQLRDFTDVAAHHPKPDADNHGLLSGKRARDEDNAPLDGDYPLSDDPFAYSDVAPDGGLIGSDRNRIIRFPVRKNTDNGKFNWKRGHVEFWWKPKQPVHLQDQAERVNVNNRQQYVTDGERITLFEQWFLARNSNIETCHYDNAKYHWNESNKTWWLETFGGRRTSPTTPNFPTYNVPEEFSSDSYNDTIQNVNGEIPGAAGYYMSLWIQDNSWYFLIRFRSFFHPNSDAGWSGSPYKTTLSGKNILGGGVLYELPIEENTKPVPGFWTRVVLNWEIKNTGDLILDLEYIDNEGANEDAVVNANSTTQKNKNMLAGNFWINQSEKANIKELWGEGNIVGKQVLMSNFGTAKKDDGPHTIGFVPAGWPPTWNRNDEYLPTLIGPKRIDRYQSIGHLGGRIRRRGPKETSSSNFTIDANYNDWWVSFAEGTIDEAYITSHPGNARNGDGMINTNKRYYHSASSPPSEYVGRGYRSDDSMWDKSGDEGKFNGYARNDQKVFSEQSGIKMEILYLAHTQYRPRTNRYGEEIIANARPNFEFAFKTENGSYQEVNINEEKLDDPELQDRDQDEYPNWNGAPISPDALLDSDTDLQLSENDAYLQYRARANFAIGPMNIRTPYLEDVTILYKKAGKPSIKYLSSKLD